MTHSDIFITSFGWAGVAATEQGVCCVVLPKQDRASVKEELNRVGRGARSADKPTPVLSRISAAPVRLLQKYFSGERVSFDLVLDLRDYTAFQQKVWQAVATIPYGETRSYALIARMIANSQAARAVGQAMGANPIPILIP